MNGTTVKKVIYSGGLWAESIQAETPSSDITSQEILPSGTSYYLVGSQHVAMRSNNNVRYLFGDHLGSTSVSADVSGGSITRQLYKAWGETRYRSGLPTKYQYTGQYANTSDFGLMFYNAWCYDPKYR